MILLNLLRRMGVASDNALFPSLDIRGKKICHSLIRLQVLCKVTEPSVDQPTADNSQTHPATTQVTVPPTACGLRVVEGNVSNDLTARVLARLAESEIQAPLGSRDDIRIAWITVLKADEGHPTPFAQAFFQYFGVSPEKLIPFLAARAEIDRIYAQSQAAWLEKYLPFRHHDGWRETFARIQAQIDSEKSFPPKKPAASVPAPSEKKSVA